MAVSFIPRFNTYKHTHKTQYCMTYHMYQVNAYMGIYFAVLIFVPSFAAV